jgi:3-(3-hydroxy-phenyl)propionate hydroxylase
MKPRVMAHNRPPQGGTHDLEVALKEHAVVIAGGGPTGMMLAGELALAGVDVAVIERRATREVESSRAGGLAARTLEVLDQRGIADRFISEGRPMQVARFADTVLDLSDFPIRHNYGLALWQRRFEEILAAWVDELPVRMYRGREVTDFAQDAAGVNLRLADGESVAAQYLVGCDGGRSLIRKAAGIEFPGWDASTSFLLAEVEMTEEPEVAFARDAKGVHAMGRLEDGHMRVVVRE